MVVSNGFMTAALTEGKNVGRPYQLFLGQRRINGRTWEEVFGSDEDEYELEFDEGVVDLYTVHPRDIGSKGLGKGRELVVGPEDKMADWLYGEKRKSGQDLTLYEKSFEQLAEEMGYAIVGRHPINSCYVVAMAKPKQEGSKRGTPLSDAIDISAEFPELAVSWAKEGFEEQNRRIRVTKDNVKAVDVGSGILRSPNERFNIETVHGGAEKYARNEGTIVVDIVRSGDSMEDKKLGPVDVLYHSEPVVLVDRDVLKQKKGLVEEVVGPLNQAVREAQQNDEFNKFFEPAEFETKYPRLCAGFWRKRARLTRARNDYELAERYDRKAEEILSSPQREEQPLFT